jgi:hypothetical protein
MINFGEIFGKYFSSKRGKAEQITIERQSNYNPIYGNDLLCARYYNEDESKYADIYVPLKGPIGLYISGGADSALLAYLLAKTIKEYNLNIKILPISFKRDDKPWNLWTAANVIEKIENILNLEKGQIFLSHNFCDFGNYREKEIHSNKIKKHITLLKENKLITLVYNGLTHNPDPLPKELQNERETSRDVTLQDFIIEKTVNAEHYGYFEENIISNPFLFLDKSFIANLYKKHNLLESLLPYTRSCEGFAKSTNFFKTSCKRCWWCKERNWAFSKYVDDPYKHIPASDQLKKTCVAI